MVKEYIILEKAEASGSFRNIPSVSHKQGWEFRDLQNFHCILARKKKKVIKRRIATITKTKVQIYKEVLKDVSANFGSGEKIIRERTKEICFREKLSVEGVIDFPYAGLSFWCYSLLLVFL